MTLVKRLRYPIVPAVEGSWKKATAERKEAADRIVILEHEVDYLEERLAIQDEEVLSLEKALRIAKSELEGLGKGRH